MSTFIVQTLTRDDVQSVLDALDVSRDVSEEQMHEIARQTHDILWRNRRYVEIFDSALDEATMSVLEVEEEE